MVVFVLICWSVVGQCWFVWDNVFVLVCGTWLCLYWFVGQLWDSIVFVFVGQLWDSVVFMLVCWSVV